MVKVQGNRKGCKDVFNAFLVKDAAYAGNEEIPIIKPYDSVLPEKMVLFSKRHQAQRNFLGCVFMRMIINLKIFGEIKNFI